MRTGVISQVVLAVALLLSAGSSADAGTTSWDFDDGTLQGWTKVPPFNGSLFVENGYMVATDSMAGGGALFVRAPSISGDLSNLVEMSYRQFVYNNPTALGTAVYVGGTDGTYWRTSYGAAAIGTWVDRSVRFDDPTQWVRAWGTSSFDTVLRSADGLFIDMDASAWSGVRECAIDDIRITFIPTPGAMLLGGIGVSIVTWLRGRRMLQPRSLANRQVSSGPHVGQEPTQCA